MEELWERIYLNNEYTGKMVSNKGRAKREKDGKELFLADNGNGYFTIGLTTYISKAGNKVTKREYIHRLVAQYFIGNSDNLPQVNHIDCDKANNCVENLEWVSGSSNILDAHKKERMTKRSNYGSITHLTEEQVVELYTAVKRDGEGISAKAREMGFSRTTASSIINKRSRSDITDKLDILFKND